MTTSSRVRTRACAGLYLFVSGCASTQLNYNTLDLATGVGDIQTQQALYNLSVVLDDPAAIPTHVDLSEGTASTTNSIDPSISLPIAQTIAQATVTAGAANQLQNALARTGGTLFVLTAAAQSMGPMNLSGSSDKSGKAGLAASVPHGSVLVGGQVGPLLVQ